MLVWLSFFSGPATWQAQTMVCGKKYGAPCSSAHQNDRLITVYTMRWYDSTHLWVFRNYVSICLLGVFRLCRVLEIGSDKLGNKLVLYLIVYCTLTPRSSIVRYPASLGWGIPRLSRWNRHRGGRGSTRKNVIFSNSLWTNSDYPNSLKSMSIWSL